MEQEHEHDCKYFEDILRLRAMCDMVNEALHPNTGYVIRRLDLLNGWRNKMLGGLAICGGLGVLAGLGSLLERLFL